MPLSHWGDEVPARQNCNTSDFSPFVVALSVSIFYTNKDEKDILFPKEGCIIVILNCYSVYTYKHLLTTVEVQ